jgi:AraC-like DNA-binding protein
MVDMRGVSPVRVGTFAYEGHGLVTDWHSHDLHQLEYACQGTVEVETSAGHYLLPPQQAAWIPARLTHQTTINDKVKTVSVFFDPELLPDPGDRVRILAATPVIREMILYGIRWPVDRPRSDDMADDFFTALAHLVTDALDHETPLHLPTSADPVIAAAMAYTNEHLGSATIARTAREVGVSERTLRRRFRAAVGTPWRSYLLQARLMRAMVLLAEPGLTVLDVATRVGFDSVSAFTRTFVQHVGQTPTAYRRRIARAT